MRRFIDQSNWGRYCRRVFDDHVQWVPRWVIDEDDVDYWRFSVYKYPFVPDYHLTHYIDDSGGGEDSVLSTHKTLAEALDILNLLLRNGGVVYLTD